MLLSASWSIEVHIKKRYHQEVGIPLAKHIKVTEEVSRKNRRSVGGGPASPYIYPYMVNIMCLLYLYFKSIWHLSVYKHFRRNEMK